MSDCGYPGMKVLQFAFDDDPASTYLPQNYITLTDEGDLKNMQKLIDMLEDNDDVQNVWHNWENE